MGIVGWWGALGIAMGADTGVEMDLSGGSTPAALNGPLRDGLRERGVPMASYHGSARGLPIVGTKASAGLEVTCPDGTVRTHAVTDLAVPVSSGDNSWARVARTVGEALLASVDCSAPAPPPPPTPDPEPTDPDPSTDEAQVDTGVDAAAEPDGDATLGGAEPRPPEAAAEVEAPDPVQGAAQPGPYQDALTHAFRRAGQREEGLTSVKFSGTAQGKPLFGVSASATAEVVCGDVTHPVDVSGVLVPLGDTHGWNHIGDTVVQRLLRDLSCD